MQEAIIDIIRDLRNRLEILERSVGGNGDWQTPTLLNSWVNYNASIYQSAGYFRSGNGIIYLRGLIKSGSVPSTVFTLPSGYRPNSTIVANVISNGAIGRVEIEADGDVNVVSGNNTYVSLDGISFRP